jgi:hypothetical protein
MINELNGSDTISCNSINPLKAEDPDNLIEMDIEPE